MADLVIQEEDGWIEISDVIPELSRDALRELWGYAGKGEIDNIQALLDMEAGADLEDRIGMADIVGARVIAVPDDMLGERLRVWVKIG